MSNIVRMLLVLFSTLGLASCDKPVIENEIYGLYQAEYLGDTDVLIVSNSSVYIHKYTGSDGTEITEEGLWRFESLGREENGISFDKFVVRGPNNALGLRGIWHRAIERQGEGVKMCFEYDLNYCFVKPSLGSG